MMQSTASSLTYMELEILQLNTLVLWILLSYTVTMFLHMLVMWYLEMIQLQERALKVIFFSYLAARLIGTQ